jgi:hypothetical protein
MTRLLIYGGCHARVLADLLSAYGEAPAVQTDCLINFQLIQSGNPFPVQDIERYDLVIYSPIENKGAYNTAFLKDACRKAGVSTICFPWLEWHGYAPGAKKVALSPTLDWAYPELFSQASNFSNFDSFVESTLRNFPSREAVRQIVKLSTRHIEGAERRADADVSVSGFIQREYKAQRLFLTSDHPSKVLYSKVLNDIADRAGIELRDGARELAQEPQPELVMPVFPIVAEELELEFAADPWRDDYAMTEIRDFLRLHYVHGANDSREESGVSGD